MNSKYSQGFSLKFALLMVQMADRANLLWLDDEINPYPDDDPQNLRHLSIRIKRPNFLDIEAECWVHKRDDEWQHGSVRIGHCLENGLVYSHEPEMFFEYHHEHGMHELRILPIELIEIPGGFVARAQEKSLDSTPSVRHCKEKLPAAKGQSAYEALGSLLWENQKLFGVVIRRVKGEE